MIGFLNPVLFEIFSRADIALKISISVLIIAPISFFMGIPFPYGIRKIPSDVKVNRYMVAYSWGINGFFSVIGSVVIVMLSMSYGFKMVFVTTALIYLAAMITSKRLDTKVQS